MNESYNDTYIEMKSTIIILKKYSNTEDQTTVQFIPCDDFQLKEHQGIPYLELRDISQQLEDRFGREIVIDVWEELGLRGTIYRYGNHGPDWVLHGETRGFT